MTPLEFDSLEEAIACAQAELEPGEEIHLHAEDCDVDEEGDGCTCEPVIVVYTKRAEA